MIKVLPYFLLLAASIHAQTYTGRIRGCVTDPQFRAEAYSAMNHSQWGNPGNNLSNRNTLGVITNAGGARSIELAMRFF